MNAHSRPDSAQGKAPVRAYDWLFLFWIALEIAASIVFIGFALIVAAGSLLTRLRQSRRKQVSLWGIAAFLTLLAASPFIFGLFDITIVEESPVSPYP